MKTIWIVLNPVKVQKEGKTVSFEETFSDEHDRPLPIGAFPYFDSKAKALLYCDGSEDHVIPINMYEKGESDHG